MTARRVLCVAACLLAVVPFGSVVHADEPSFDCRKATTWSERAVCADAALAGLDKEVAGLYREARARQPHRVDELKSEQRQWLRRREQCGSQPDPAQCLTAVYRQRQAELGMPPASPGTVGQGQLASTSPRGRLLPLTPAVVWHGDSSAIYQQCTFGDDPCALRIMRAQGASDEALRFAERINGWAVEFVELGPVDVVSAVGTFAANTLDYLFLVNAIPDLVSLDDYRLTAADRARSDVREALSRLPDGSFFNHRFVRKETTPRGSRFVVEADYARCNACRNEALARAQIAYDLDADHRLIGASLLTLKPAAQGPTR